MYNSASNVTDVLNVSIPKIDNSRVIIDPVCKGNIVKCFLVRIII
jgi:hypothetical protein